MRITIKQLLVVKGKFEELKVRLISMLILAAAVTNCTTINVPLYDIPPDLKEDTLRIKTINSFSEYLKEKKIFLDPGHGGEDRKNKNRSGDVIEADVNLRVALNLRKFLVDAGAQVELSRDIDKTVQLAYRSVLADSSGADLFISIHHNAPAKWEDDWTNYTSTYYHAKETDYEYEPSERDVARYIQRDLSYVMGNPGGLGSFDGTYSDYLIYPGQGFSVLRRTKIPSVLVECAFHTSHFEELRLNDELFNEIQAWGIFRGLGKYYKNGIPQINFVADSSKIENEKLLLFFNLSDTSGINWKSIQVLLNKEEISFEVDKEKNLLKVWVNNTGNEKNIIRIICSNKNGNHSLPYHKQIVINDSRIILTEIN
jgi:N-acetylmuramoyl-L-alanine amidase